MPAYIPTQNSTPESGLSEPVPVEVPPAEVAGGPAFPGLSAIGRASSQVRTLLGLLRTRPFDTSTEEGRSQERYRRAALTTLTSVLAKGVMVFTSLLTVRLTIRYLGTERYGLWMTITSVVSLLQFADLGIGNGLLNVIAEAHGRDDAESVHKYASSAFFVLLAIAVALLAILSLVYPFIPWPRVFNVTSPIAVREAGPAVLVFLVCFLMNIPLDVVQRIQTGHQEGYATNFWLIVGSLTGLGSLLAVLHWHGGLPLLILAILGGQILGVLGNWVHEFGFVRPGLFPDRAHWDSSAARKIMGTGIMFFLLQICGIFTVPVDYIVITQILGPEAVTQYSVPIRLFVLVVTIATMFVMPLWPAYGEALARGDSKWVKSTFYHSLGYSAVIFCPIALALAPLGKGIVRIWVGPQVHPTLALLFGMSLYSIGLIANVILATFLYGMNKLKFQVAVGLTQALVGLVLRVAMAKAFGITGVVWANDIMIFLGTTVIMLYVLGLLANMDVPLRRTAGKRVSDG